jgi:hypothetical protein
LNKFFNSGTREPDSQFDRICSLTPSSSTAVKILDEIQPTAQSIVAYRARLLSGLAGTLLAAQVADSPVASGLRLIRDELNTLEQDIRTLEPEIDVDGLLAKPPADGYTLEEMLAILDRRAGR